MPIALELDDERRSAVFLVVAQVALPGLTRAVRQFSHVPEQVFFIHEFYVRSHGHCPQIVDGGSLGDDIGK